MLENLTPDNKQASKGLETNVSETEQREAEHLHKEKVGNVRNEEAQEVENRHYSTLQKIFQDISSDSRLFLNTLNERRENRFNQLLDDAQFSGIAVNFKILDAVKLPADTEQATKALKSIGILINEIKIRPSASVRDNPENLQKLIFSIKNLQTKIDDVMTGLINLEDDRTKELKDAVKMTRDSTEKARGYLASLLNNLPR